MGSENLVLHRYQDFAEFQALDRVQRTSGDRAGSLLYELMISMMVFAVLEIMLAGVQELHAFFGGAGSAAGVSGDIRRITHNSCSTILYCLQWARDLVQTRVNCIGEFTMRGRDGLVALHHRYFAPAEWILADSVTKEFDSEFACTKAKVNCKYLAEKEVHGREFGSQFQERPRWAWHWRPWGRRTGFHSGLFCCRGSKCFFCHPGWRLGAGLLVYYHHAGRSSACTSI
ncbi:hypothetical protein Vafri_14642 [Volvox africanus]|uniref:Uncharacterized protein n=1 Tax=Volvox africanus TaxID=51714 RepID=A0A8J4BER4_9CHLO|nr:hypothetical protein Vafri_14642 [Volvox africanus]